MSPANIRENMRRLSARPHHVGSPYDKDNAEWILSKFKEWGFDAQIETFNVLFPTPKERVVEMLQPDQISGQAAGTGPGHRSHQRSDRRAASHLQRLFGRWRRDCAAGLRELRQPRRLRTARPPGNFGQGRHRDCPLRRRAGAASSRRLPASTEPSAASSIPTRKATATTTATIIPTGAGVRERACSAAA